MSARSETTPTSKRLEFLLKQTAPGGAGVSDPFAWYCLAMEFRALGRHGEALATFEELRTRAADYVPMYLMCAQMLEKMGRLEEARAWLQRGIEAARAKGDAHALSELEGAAELLRELLP
jgi:predicted RNA polymerase sigma factor